MLFIIIYHDSINQQLLSSTTQKTMNAAIFMEPNRIITQRIKLTNHEETCKTTLLRVKACALCGYDARVFRHGHEKVTPPIILGHEICAETIDDLRLADGGVILAGTRVAVSPLIPCLNCIYCLRRMYNLCIDLKEIGSSVNGGLAEFVQIPQVTLRIGGIIPIPNKLGDEEASLIEPLSCCINGLSRLNTKNIENDHTVCIIGDGPIGLIHLRLLCLLGAHSIVVGRVESRMKTARYMGASSVVEAGNDTASTARVIFDLTNGLGADIVIVATSDPNALSLATKIASKNAQISLFAGMPKHTQLHLDVNSLHYKQISLVGSFSATPDSIRQAIKFVSNNQLNLSELISHSYPLCSIEDAFVATESFRGLRIVINRF